jgi:hypothetical protein
LSKENLIEYTVIPNDKIAEVIVTECDPSVSLMNHRFLGGRYKEALEGLHKRFPTTAIKEVTSKA